MVRSASIRIAALVSISLLAAGLGAAALTLPRAALARTILQRGMSGGGLGVVVADVSGHGLGPALLMSEGRTALRLVTRPPRAIPCPPASESPGPPPTRYRASGP